jgi:hypothetical protein
MVEKRKAGSALTGQLSREERRTQARSIGIAKQSA